MSDDAIQAEAERLYWLAIRSSAESIPEMEAALREAEQRGARVERERILRDHAEMLTRLAKERA